jgi:kynurenine formamidase
VSTEPINAQALLSNWGRWGDDDERGTLNFITDEARARGAALARTGRTVSLAHPIVPTTLAGGGPLPHGLSPMPAPVQQMLTYTGSPAHALSDVLVVNTHHVAMTHLDALAHIPVDGQVYPGVPIAQAEHRGTLRHGSTTPFASGITTAGVLLDLAPGDSLAPGHGVTGADLDAAEQRAGVRVQSGDAVVVRGGWVVHQHLDEPLPAMTLDAVRWLAEREVSVLASDIGDHPPGLGGPPLLHSVGLARLGLPLVDNADVSPLAAVCSELRSWSFLFVLGAPPIRGATGVPVNPLAIFLPEQRMSYHGLPKTELSQAELSQAALSQAALSQAELSQAELSQAELSQAELSQAELSQAELSQAAAFAVAQVVLHERQGRDRGWWEQMSGCFWPDSTVRLSWYDGDGPGFVAGSEAIVRAGLVTTHQIFSPVVHVRDDRAHVEAPAIVRSPIVVDGVRGEVRCDLLAHTRLNYRLERRDGEWRILSLDPIYEHTTLTPSVPGERITVPAGELAPFRSSYAILAWDAWRSGRSVNQDLLGDDRPEPVAAFYTELRKWLEQHKETT